MQNNSVHTFIKKSVVAYIQWQINLATFFFFFTYIGLKYHHQVKTVLSVYFLKLIVVVKCYTQVFVVPDNILRYIKLPQFLNFSTRKYQHNFGFIDVNIKTPNPTVSTGMGYPGG